MTRAPGKYKQKRGGGRSFSRNLTLNEDGIAVGEDSRAKRSKKRDADSEDDSGDEEDGDEESEEEEDDDDQPEGRAGPSTGIVEEEEEEEEPELSRAERKALKKQKKQGPIVDEEDKDLINPNRLPVKAMAISDLKAPRELSRREREAKEKAESKERYWKMHQAGKTDEAKSDLARLNKIKQEREAAQAARKAAEDAKATSTSTRE